MHIMMELCKGGSLFDQVKALSKADRVLGEATTAAYVKTLLQVAELCHKRGKGYQSAGCISSMAVPTQLV